MAVKKKTVPEDSAETLEAPKVSIDERMLLKMKEVNAKWTKRGITTKDRPIVGTIDTMLKLRGTPIPTGNLILDVKLSGGMMRGTSSLWWGPSGCLSADTWINYGTRKNGKRQSHKGGTIERLYDRFHGFPLPVGLGNYHRKQSRGSDFYVPSITDEGYLTKSKVVDVVDSGVKETFLLTTSSGKTIRATGDHEFFVGEGYKPLSELKVGDSVYCYPSQETYVRRKRLPRPETYVKYHSVARTKVVNGCLYYRMSKHHLAYEAYKNGFSYEDYVVLLNTGKPEDIDSLWTVPKGQEIHHRDGNTFNNSPSNLEMMDKRAHATLHWHQEPNRLSKRVGVDPIVSIEPAGTTQVYDIICEEPNRNFIANGIAVHNCGKSSAAMASAAAVWKAGGTILWIQAEEGNTKEMAAVFGIDPSSPRFIHQDVFGSGEMAFEVLEAFLMEEGRPSNLIDLVVLDSIPGLAPKEELAAIEKDGLSESSQGMALPERMMSRLFRVLHSTKALDHAHMIFISQARVDMGCFSYNTRVSLSDGTQKRIGQIVDSDDEQEVLSYNEADGTFHTAKVTKKFNNGKATDHFLRMKFSCWPGQPDSKLCCTPNHHILCVKKDGKEAYRRADKMRPGDKVVQCFLDNPLKSDQAKIPIRCTGVLLEVKLVMPTIDNDETYDLEVEGSHNYVAGGIVVHNSYMTPLKHKGGHATAHSVRVNLRFSPMGGKDGLIMRGDTVIGHKYKIKFIKDGAKHRWQHYEFENQVIYQRGFDEDFALRFLLLEAEAFEKSGAWLTPKAPLASKLPPEFATTKIGSQDKLLEVLKTNKPYRDGCVAYLFATAGPVQEWPATIAEAEAIPGDADSEPELEPEADSVDPEADSVGPEVDLEFEP